MQITRKDFLKIAGAMLSGCKPRSSVSTEGGAIGEVKGIVHFFKVIFRPHLPVAFLYSVSFMKYSVAGL
jgi:hypothetical protein